MIGIRDSRISSKKSILSLELENKTKEARDKIKIKPPNLGVSFK
jgi:hypothetical protein